MRRRLRPKSDAGAVRALRPDGPLRYYGAVSEVTQQPDAPTAEAPKPVLQGPAPFPPAPPSPAPGPLWLAYVAPMALFLLLTVAEGKAPLSLYPLLYIGKALLVTVALAVFSRAWRPEIRFEARVLPAAVLVGLVTLAEWVLIDRFVPYPHLGTRTGYNPFQQIADPALRGAFFAVRFYGLAVMVPVMEEVFWRSFVLRYATDQDRWWSLPVGTFSLAALGIMTALFALAHPEWLVAAVCALLYAGLLRWTKSLFAVIVAHGVTNLGLGIYVLVTGDWKYW